MPGRVQIYRPGLTEPVFENVNTTAEARALIQREITGLFEQIPGWNTIEGGAPCRAFHHQESERVKLQPNRLAQIAWERAQVGSGRTPYIDTLQGTVCVVTGDPVNDL